jgi:autotransporter strand-loop-strand O-heptosyltransferase
MYKSISFYASFNERTGYGIHATRLVESLEKLISVHRNQPGGEVSISLIDSVSIQNVTTHLPYPSILYNVWESTEQPQWFMDKLQYFDQLWVPTEAQKAWSIAQGIPEEFVKVVHEGIDPTRFFPVKQDKGDLFNFLYVGQWQPRKSTIECIKSFLEAFPISTYPNVRLQLNADTLFPSDTYSSTEERLKAYGLEDPRIIPIHHEEGDDYVRRMQQADVFLSCARSEGWGLPICESMASGIPSIVADWGGSTEYAGEALKVNIVGQKKPQGIYGDWDVPGEWGEPDYSHLTEVIRDSYHSHTTHKAKALITSEHIRTKFSWDAAANQAYSVLSELYSSSKAIPAADIEKAIQTYARKFGYEIPVLRKRSAIFTMDTHPTSQEQLDTLTETIIQIKRFGYPLLISSHIPLPPSIVEMVDYYIYDKRDILSWGDMPIYTRVHSDGTIENTPSSIPCHACASTHNVRNAIDFVLGKYDWIYHLCYDTEIDLGEWLDKVHASDKGMIVTHWENNPLTIGGQAIAAKTELMDKLMLHLDTWDDFAKEFGEDRFCGERKLYKIAVDKIGLDNIEFISIPLANRYDQVDREVWTDELFECHFVEGPFLNIIGISNREYDVCFSSPVDGSTYSLKQQPNNWSRPSAKFYRDWTISASLDGELKYQHTLDLTGKRVLISMGSRALGDTLAWIPYVEEFRKKHSCHVILSSWWNSIFDYPEIEWATPGDAIPDIYATYDIGCFDNQPDKNPINWREVPLQKVAADILGLDYEPLRAKLKQSQPTPTDKPSKPYICFSEFSTMQNKLWNREGAWQTVINHLISLGYDCISISAEPSQLSGIIKHNGQSIEQTISDLSGAAFYLGLNHGPAWLAYSLDIPTIMITGISEEWNDFPMFARIATDTCRPGCFNDPTLPIDRDWNWCPRNKNYACTSEITEDMVIKEIDRIATHYGKSKVKATKKRKKG